jgi:hypothetical protein
MFADILKALEVIDEGPGRQAGTISQKEPLRLYVDNEAVAAGGREILEEIAPGIVYSEPKARLIKLMSEDIHERSPVLGLRFAPTWRSADVLHLRFLNLVGVWSKCWKARRSRTSSKT